MNSGDTKPYQRIVTFLQIGDIPEGMYSLSIRSLDDNFGFSETIELLYDGKTSSIFIQTDKPIYTPGDNVRFRIVAIDADTRPVTSYKTIDVALNDTAGNSIRHWKYATLYNGVFESKVQLASSPILGKWNLSATVGDYVSFVQ